MSQFTESIRIRAHHLLCIQGFQGLGYSQDFVKKTQEIRKKIMFSPGTRVEICTGCDVLCLHCPHEKGGICEKEPSSASALKKMDEEVLRIGGIESGSIMVAEEALTHINRALAEVSEISRICGDCEWKKKCLWYIGQNCQLPFS